MSISPASDRSGFTLLEAMIAGTILAGLLLVALESLSGSSRQVTQSIILDTMRMEANQALHKIAQDLKATERGAVSTTSTSLTARRTSLEVDPDTGEWGQSYGAPSVYSVSGGQLIVTFVTSRTLANDVSAFTVTPAQAPLLAETVTLSLTLTRRVGLNPDGSAQNLSVTTTRTVFVRPNLAP